MKKFIVVTTAIAALGLVTSANAADMPTKAPVAVAAPFSWAGWYLGLNAGYAVGHSKMHEIDPYNGPPDITYNPSGFQGGAHFGYNFQMNRYVLGVEGEVGYLGWKKSAQFPPYIGVRTPADSVAATSNGAFGVLAVRIGAVFDNTLMFVKGGGIFTDVKNSFTDTDPVGATLVSGTDTKNRNGWTAGGGFEFALARNWAARIEYAHYGFGTAQHTAITNGGTPVRFEHSLSADSVRLGLTYLLH